MPPIFCRKRRLWCVASGVLLYTALAAVSFYWGFSALLAWISNAVLITAVAWMVLKPDAFGRTNTQPRHHSNTHSAHQKNLIQKLIDVIPEPVYIKDKHGYYIIINKALCRQRGMSADQILGHSVLEHAAGRPDWIAMVQEEERQVLAGTEIFKEESFLSPTGETRHRIVSKGLCLGEDGEPLIVGANFDVTSWRQAEHQLKEMLDAQSRLYEFLQTILDTLPNPLYVKDAQHRYIFINTVQAKTTGLPASSLLTKTANDVWPAPLAKEIHDLEQKMLNGPDGVIYETEHLLPDKHNTLHPTIVRRVVARDTENQRVIIAVNTDISEICAYQNALRQHHDNLKELVQAQTADLITAKDAAERANEAKSLFLANMSHELRTPLHAVLSFARMGKEKHLNSSPEKILHYFNRIIKSGERLLGMLNDLLDLAKLESGHLTIDIKTIDLKLIVKEVLREFEAWSESKNIQLHLTENECANTKGDSNQLAQVVRNLLSNALKFSPENGHIHIDLKPVANTQQTPMLEMRVTDQGPGIPPAEIDLIFDKFFQSSKTRTGAGGTGLGLAICREIIAAHGGSIHAHNTEPCGAAFVVQLPLSPPAHEAV